MQSRLPIVLISAAGTAALFGVGFLLGLGVMSTPNKPEQHKQIALTTTPTKVTRTETTGAGTQSERALTPLTPVAPGGAAAQTATPAPAQTEPKPTQQAAAAQPAPAPQPQQKIAAAAPAASPPAKLDEPQAKPAPAPAPVQTAKAEPAPAAQPVPNATPVSLSTRNACDVSACSRAYRSFRESDCTYQPFSGPRQVCVSPPGAKEAARGHDSRQAARSEDDEPAARVRVHRPGRDVELSNVVHEVERMTDGRRGSDDSDQPRARSYHRDFTADGEDDRIEPADGGRRRGFFFDSEDDDQ
jgi:outer membrane biosynthesis protein TonB